MPTYGRPQYELKFGKCFFLWFQFSSRDLAKLPTDSSSLQVSSFERNLVYKKTTKIYLQYYPWPFQKTEKDVLFSNTVHYTVSCTVYTIQYKVYCILYSVYHVYMYILPNVSVSSSVLSAGGPVSPYFPTYLDLKVSGINL